MGNGDFVQTINRKKLINAFTAVGLGACVMVLMLFIPAYFLGWMPEKLYEIFTTVLLPFVSVALAVVAMKAVDNEVDTWFGKTSFGSGVCAFFICIFAMYAGNLVGTLITGGIAGLFGKTFVSLVDTSFSGGNLVVSAIEVCVFAPLCEEFIFRKEIIDRLRKYGEKTAIAVSALCFALYHTNLEQTLYTFCLGLVLGYVYDKTGKIWTTMALHASVNLFMGVIPMVLQKDFSLEIALMGVSDGTVNILENPRLLAVVGFSLVELLFALVGLVIFVIKIVRVRFSKPECEVAGSRFKALLSSVGMIIFILLAVFLTGYRFWICLK